AGIDEGDSPILDVAVDQLPAPAAFREDEVVRDALLVVQEVLLDEVAPISQAEDEVLVPEVGVVLHEMPDDRAVTERDHRLGHVLGVVAEPHAQTPAEQDDLHRLPLSPDSKSPLMRCPQPATAARAGRLLRQRRFSSSRASRWSRWMLRMRK